jgi:hypothetical protein
VETQRNKSAKNSEAPARASDGKPARGSDAKPKHALTEDEADIRYGEKHKHEPGNPLRQALKELGINESEVGL